MAAAWEVLTLLAVGAGGAGAIVLGWAAGERLAAWTRLGRPA